MKCNLLQFMHKTVLAFCTKYLGLQNSMPKGERQHINRWIYTALSASTISFPQILQRRETKLCSPLGCLCPLVFRVLSPHPNLFNISRVRTSLPYLIEHNQQMVTSAEPPPYVFKEKGILKSTNDCSPSASW